MMKILILGLGSPFGDDCLGWVAAEMLQRSPVVTAAAGMISVSALDRPGTLLVEHWRGADSVILIDAVRSGAAPGTLHRLDGGGIDDGDRTTSSHGFGVAAALELGRALGDIPARICLYGIEMDPAHAGASVSPAVRAALPALISRIEKRLARQMRVVVASGAA